MHQSRALPQCVQSVWRRTQTRLWTLWNCRVEGVCEHTTHLSTLYQLLKPLTHLLHCDLAAYYTLNTTLTAMLLCNSVHVQGNSCTWVSLHIELKGCTSNSGVIHTRNTHGAHFEGKLVPVPLVAHHGTEQQTFVNWLSAGQVVLESVGRDSFVPAGT